MAKFEQPPKFSFKATEWEDWICDFSQFRIASKINEEPGEVQVASLLYAMGAKSAKELLATFHFQVIAGPDGTNVRGENDYDTVVAKFTDHFVPKKNIIHERFIFQERKQQPEETVEEYLRALQTLVKTCSYSDSAEQVRDRFVIGLKDVTVKLKLQLDSTLTLDKAVQIARQHEQLKLQSQQQEHSTVNEVHTPRGRGRGRGQYRGRVQYQIQGQTQGQSQGQRQSRCQSQQNVHQKQFNSHQKQHFQPPSSSKCSRCAGYHGRHRCPASGKTCHICKKQGHFAIACRYRRADEVEVHSSSHTNSQELLQPVQLENLPQGTTVMDKDGNTFWLNTILCDERSQPWTVELPICGSFLKFKIDTGADISVLSESTYHQLSQKPPLQPCNISLMSPGGQVPSVGEFVANTKIGNEDYKFRVVVARQDCSSLLSRDVAEKMKLVARIQEVQDEVFGECGLMKTSPVKIYIDHHAVPYSVATARRVPFPIMEKVKEELHRLQSHGIIEPVTEPTPWCSPMVPVIKKSGQIRICVDYKKLNLAVKRQMYMLPNLEDIAPKLAGSSVFSSLDAASGYFQIPLESSSKLLTTFMTPFGRFCFRRVPMGISSAPEIFQRKMSELLAEHDGCEVIMDDIIIYGKTREEHDERLAAVLKTIKESGLKLNKAKCQFHKSELKYFGHIVGKEGIKPNPEKVEAVKNLKAPTNVSELRTTLGMINYLCRFTEKLSHLTKPMSDLLRADTAWNWSTAQEEAFNAVKEKISQLPSLNYFDVQKETIVSADASSFGIGGALMQKDDNKLRPIAYCSRTLTDAEKKYSQIEKELLAAVWSCEKFSKYLIGLPTFELVTDHKPLVPLLTTKDLDQGPLRCQRMLMKMMKFNAQVRHVAGKDNVIADTLSRNPLLHTEEGENESMEEYIDSVKATWPTTDNRLNDIKVATARDATLQVLSEYIINGWPRKDVIPNKVREFQQDPELSVVDGIITKGSRIVIPESMREEVLQKLHESHQGISKCRERAKEAIWWPGLSKDIYNLISSCDTCQSQRPTQRHEPLKTTALPGRPWESIAVDLCEIKGKQYLVLVDYYSRWIEYRYLSHPTSSNVSKAMKDIFTIHGLPDVVQSDNGPQFISREFAQFASDYGFVHKTSTPYMSQTNGEAERAVQIVKSIMATSDPLVALLNYRATPHSTIGVSPSEALMGRRLRTRLPTLTRNLLPKTPDPIQLQAKDREMKAHYKKDYDRRHGVKPLPALQPDIPVLVKLDHEKKWNNKGSVVLADPGNRRYLIQTPTGMKTRNRKHLQPVIPVLSPKRETSPPRGVLSPVPNRVSPLKRERMLLPMPPVSPQPPRYTAPDQPRPPEGYRTRSGRLVVKPKRFGFD